MMSIWLFWLRWDDPSDSVVNQRWLFGIKAYEASLLQMVSHYQKSLGQKIKVSLLFTSNKIEVNFVYHRHQSGVNHPQTLVCRFALINKTTKLSLKSSTQRTLKGERIFFFFLFSTQQTHYSTQLIVASA